MRNVSEFTFLSCNKWRKKCPICWRDISFSFRLFNFACFCNEKTLFRCGIIYTNSINYAIGIIFPLINFNNTRACAYELCRYKPEGEISHVGIINERTTSYEIWQFNKFDARRLFPFLFRARPTFSRKLYDKLLPHLAYKWPIFITRN